MGTEKILSMILFLNSLCIILNQQDIYIHGNAKVILIDKIGDKGERNNAKMFNMVSWRTKILLFFFPH